MVVNRSNLYVGQTVFFVHKEYNSLTKMKEDSIVECKITKIGRVYITINNGYPNRQFFIKSGNDYEFGIQEKENAIDCGILCFTREDAEKHLLKKKMMLELRNINYSEKTNSLNQLLLMKLAYEVGKLDFTDDTMLKIPLPVNYKEMSEETMKDQLKRALISEDDTMNYSYFEGKKVDPTEIIELAKTVPFFNDHRFIILDGTGLGKKSDDLFIKVLKDISDTSVLLFIEDTIDKRSKIYKFLSKQGHAACFEPMKNKELSQWITLLLKKDEKQMSISTMNNFLYRCGSDMHTLKNELDKLISYVGDRKEITSYDLEQLTSSQTINQIFIMLDAIARKQRDKVLTLYYDLIELKESPFGILALLARQCNQLLQVKNLDDLGKDNGTISKEIKIPAFAVGKLKDQSKMFSIEVLLNMVEACATTDELIKTGKINDRVGVELILIQFSQN